MTMSTPIEIVREYQRWRRAQGQYAGLCQCPHTPEEIGLALDSVLADAERFKALEAFMQNLKNEVPCIERGTTPKEVWYGALSEHTQYVTGSTLAELADRLREGAT